MTTDAVAPEEQADDRIPRARDGRHRGAYVEMLISSVLGLIAALVLSIDAIILAADPNAGLS